MASSLGLMNESGDIIQVFCRWRAAESVREYNHITPDVYADKVAAAMAVDAAQTPKRQVNVVTDDDEAMAVEISDAQASEDTSTVTRATRAKPAEAHAPKALYQQISKAPSKGATVLIPASTWPTEACDENDGQGWLAKVVTNHGAAVGLCFLTARTADGRPYEKVRLEWQHLQYNVTDGTAASRPP